MSNEDFIKRLEARLKNNGKGIIVSSFETDIPYEICYGTWHPMTSRYLHGSLINDPEGVADMFHADMQKLYENTSWS